MEPERVVQLKIGFTVELVMILVRYSGVVIGEGIEALPVRDEG